MNSPLESHTGSTVHPSGSMGQQRSFLEECRDLADPRRSGQRRVNGVNKPPDGETQGVADPIDPTLTQTQGVNKFAGNADPNPSLTREPEGGRGEEAHEVYLERLAVADEQGMDTSPSSLAEVIARREADRVAAGVPFAWPVSRGPDAIDNTLKAFAPMGGLSFVRFETKGETLVEALQHGSSLDAGPSQAPASGR